jgi:hypothetical protein
LFLRFIVDHLQGFFFKYTNILALLQKNICLYI